jgi:hypothetical protein
MSEEGEPYKKARLVVSAYKKEMDKTLDKTLDLFSEFEIPCDWDTFEIVEDEVVYLKWTWKRDFKNKDFTTVFEVRPSIDLANVFVMEGEHQRESLEEADLRKAVRRLACFMLDLE